MSVGVSCPSYELYILLLIIMVSGWARRDPASRAVLFSAAGQAKFEAFLVAGPDCAAAE